MPKFISTPTKIEAPGSIPKTIEEFVGRVNTGSHGMSVARMRSPGGWTEPGQTPEFTETTLVLRGALIVETRPDGANGPIESQVVGAGQAIVTHPGEWVRYSTPGDDGAEYVAICSPAFSPGTVHRDAATDSSSDADADIGADRVSPTGGATTGLGP